MKYFKDIEFQCNCANHCEKKMSNKLLVMLYNARILAGIPFIITSGYRCENYNLVVGGIKNSAHTRGMAVDIKANTSQKRAKILKALVKVGFNRIGIYESFIHVDVDHTKPQNVVWLG